MQTLTEHLLSLKCSEGCKPETKEAIKWGSRYKGNLQTVLKKMWRYCDRADWMLWYAGKIYGAYTPEMRLAACDCARTALKYIKEGETRPLRAIETAERFAKGKATVQKLAASAAAAYSAYAAAYATDAAACAAAYAAYATACAAAAYAAYAAAYAAYAADAAALKEMANIIRKHIPNCPGT